MHTTCIQLSWLYFLSNQFKFYIKRCSTENNETGLKWNFAAALYLRCKNYSRLFSIHPDLLAGMQQNLFRSRVVKGKWTLLHVRMRIKNLLHHGRRAKILLFGNKMQSWRNGINDEDIFFFFATCFAILFDNTSFRVLRATRLRATIVNHATASCEIVGANM